MLDKLVFRLTVLFLTFFPLVLLYIGEENDLIILKITSFSFYTYYILPWLYSFKKEMFETLSNKESYVESIFLYAFNHELKLGMIIFCGLTFSYYGYNIFAFLLILAGFSEAWMNYRVKQKYIRENS